MSKYITSGNSQFNPANFKDWTEEQFYKQYAGKTTADLNKVWKEIQEVNNANKVANTNESTELKKEAPKSKRNQLNEGTV